jgi:hypothetical protein
MTPHPSENFPTTRPFSLAGEGPLIPFTNVDAIQHSLSGKSPVQVAEALESGVDYSIDHLLAVAYGADYTSEFLSGMPAEDNVVQKRINDGRRNTTVHVVDDFGALRSEHYIDPSAPRSTPDDKDMHLALAARKGDKQMNSFLQKSLGKSWYQENEAICRAGLRRSAVLSTMMETITFDYFPETEVPEDAFAVERILQGDLVYLFEGQVVPPDITITDVIQHRRDLGRVDLSKERLDTRLQMLQGAANVEYTGFALKELRQMASLGGQRETRAKKLFAEYKDVIMGANIDQKVAVLQEISEAYSTFAFYARGGRHANAARAFQMLAMRASSVSEGYGSYMETMHRIYTNMGYEVPVQLRDYEPLPENEPEPELPVVPEQGEAAPPAEASEEKIAVDGVTRHIAEHLLEQMTLGRLDELVLPADMHQFREGLEEAIAKTTRGKRGLEGELLEKVVDIATVCANNGGSLYRSKAGQVTPEDIAGMDLSDEQRAQLVRQRATAYFVAVFDLPNGGRAILAEKERYGFATIGVNEAEAGMHWHPALMRHRIGIQQPGVVRLRHAPSAPFGERHQQKMQALLTKWNEASA